ncbi:formylglycine-generating enzyme [uncultured Gammaproteobacteria bacterium]
MAALFRRLGYEVREGRDLSREGLETLLRDFGRLAEGTDIAVAFYAGHGIQVAGRNYLIPVTAKLEREQDLRYEVVAVDTLVEELGAAKTLRLLILDSCRDNPFAAKLMRSMGTRSAQIGRGFARIETAEGNTLIAYATRADEVAADGTGAHSPYTTALLQHAETPGLTVERLFGRVRDSVLSATSGRQQPFVYGSLGGDDIHLGLPPAAAGGSATPTLAPVADPMALELVFWQSIQGSRDQADFEAYRDKYPNGQFLRLALNRLTELEASAPQQVATLFVPKPPVPRLPVRQVMGVFPETKSVFRDFLADGADCPECPELVMISRGSFTMGSPANEPERSSGEGPQHRVTIGYSLAAGKYAVTFAEWDACVAGGGCNGYRPEDQGWGRGRRPVIHVSWNDAQAYVQWLSRKTGQRYRLLSESEWEYVARAGTTTTYWWGNDVGRNNANCAGCGSQWDNKQTAPVGSFAPNAFGLYDTAGNVWQWVEDCYEGNYQNLPTDDKASTSEKCEYRVGRGGSWLSYPRYLRAAYRNGLTPGHFYNSLGFRVARTFSS